MNKKLPDLKENMMFRTHLAFSAIIALNLFYFFDFSFINSSIIVLSSLLPDIDSSKSFIGRRLKPLSTVLNRIFGHRRLFHSVWVPLLALILLHNHFLIGLSIMIGYLSHILLDIFSKESVKPFTPVSKLNIKGFIKTGGVVEKFVFLTFCLIFITEVIILF